MSVMEGMDTARARWQELLMILTDLGALEAGDVRVLLERENIVGSEPTE